MSREKSEKVCITFRLSEEEHEKLKQYSSACGLSTAEFMRQLCRGNAPQPQPEKEFWELLGTLYEVHVAFKKCIPYAPSADEICREIEDFILELQRNYTLPQQFDMEKLTEQGESDMAATSLWHIEGRLKDLISYVENPEKTVPNKEMQDFFDVFSYVKNPQKTDNGELVSAINCLKETALQQMILTKKQYQKTGGYIAWHGYQSFKPDEVTPEQCHEIGLKLAREMWGDKYQIIVVTHLDRGHLHNHFCFNSVSYLDGSKYNYSKSEQKRLRETSDRLCREYGLSVIENPKKAPSRPLYLDEKSGKPTRYNVYLEDLAEAISGSRDIPHMMKYLIDKGYEVDFSGGHWKMKLPQYKHFTRLDTLDERLTPDFIRSHLGTRARYGNYKAKISYSPHMPEEYKKAWKPHQKTRGILALYYYWCYQLGIFPKGTDYKPTSPLMKEELRKLDEITTQVRYMSEHNISTLSDLHADREKNQTEMDRLTNYRRHLQNKIRRASPAEKETLREEKNGVTERITELRKRLKYADGIEKRSAHIDDCLNQIHDTVENQRSNQNGRTDRKREDALR